MLSELSVLRRNLWSWNQGWARRLGPNQQPQKKTLAQVGLTIPSATVNIYRSQNSWESHLGISQREGPCLSLAWQDVGEADVLVVVV